MPFLPLSRQPLRLLLTVAPLRESMHHEPMIKVYQAQNIAEAHILSGLLQSEGVEARVDGEYLQGGVGELPATDFASISVPEDQFAAAQEIIRQYERGDYAASDDVNS